MLLWVFRGAELAVHKIFLKKCSKKFRNTREKTQLRGEITILLDQGKNVNISFQSLSTSSLCILAFILIISTITITSLTSASETYPKTCQTSKMEGLVKTVNGENLSTISSNRSTFDVWQGFEDASLLAS